MIDAPIEHDWLGVVFLLAVAVWLSFRARRLLRAERERDMTLPKDGYFPLNPEGGILWRVHADSPWEAIDRVTNEDARKARWEEGLWQ